MLSVFKCKNILNTAKKSTNLRNYANKINLELPKCDFKPVPYSGPSYNELLSLRRNYISCAIHDVTLYEKPLAVYAGYKQWLFDIDGNRYLDMLAGYATVSVGHCHPKIEEAVHAQINTLGHCSNVYMHPNIQIYAKKLTSKLPGDLKVVFFTNSGSEANELAILMARAYTNNYNVISFTGAYHGMTNQMIAVTCVPAYKFPQSALPGIFHVPHPDVYRGEWGGSHCRDSPIQTTRTCDCPMDKCGAANKYFLQVADQVKYIMQPNQLAAFIAESLMGVGGVTVFPKGYMSKIYNLTKEYGGLFIADEVQTGFNRTGDNFWGFEMHGIIPDIVTMAKGIGNGFPLGAVVTTPDISRALSKAEYFNTFGGNALACRVGSTVLDIMEKERLGENCKLIGTYLIKKLARLRDEYTIVGDVRGKGLMIGIELVTNKDTKIPMPPADVDAVIQFCMEHRLLLGKEEHVLRMKPPLCIIKEDADYAAAVLKMAIEKLNLKYSCYTRINLESMGLPKGATITHPMESSEDYSHEQIEIITDTIIK